MKLFMRKLHRWLGVAVALQIVAWMASGLYFSIIPIETIRGEHLTKAPETPDADALEGLVPVAVAWDRVASGIGADASLRNVTLQSRAGTIWYRVEGTGQDGPFTRLVNGVTGELLPRLDEPAARAAAEAALSSPGNIVEIEWVESVGAGSEIRGRPLPIWRVGFSEPESLNLYIDPWTGDIAARRTDRWRIFDFLWMLHIMDFDDRDDFNTPLLQIAAALGLLVALSGVIFWAMTSRVFRRKRRQRA